MLETFEHGQFADPAVDIYDRYGALDGALLDSASRQVIGAEPEDEQTDIAENRADLDPAQAARFAAIKDRLVRLGYLQTDDAKAETTPGTKFRSAVKRLQKDAEIKPDSWVGPQTWSILQAAFAVEGENRLRDHLMTASEDGGPTRLAWRAGLLRLHLIGVISGRNYKAWYREFAGSRAYARAAAGAADLCRPALDQLRKDLQSLNAPGAQDIAADDVGTLLRLVIEFDALTDLLARCDPPDQRILRKGKVKELLGKAITIELWARGFKVEIDEPAKLQRTGPERPFPKDTLLRALIQYYQCEGTPDAQARSLSLNALYNFPNLFRSFNDDLRVPEKEMEESIESEVEAYFVKNEDAFQTELSNLQKLGSWLWDGVKRVAGWFARLFKRGLRRVKQILNTTGEFLMRVGHRFARDGFHALRRARQIVVKSVGFLANPDQFKPDLGVAWNRSVDGDYTVFVDADMGLEPLRQLNKQVVLAKMVRLAGQLLGAALKIGRSIVTGAALGWLRFWLTLMRVARRAGDWVREADALWYKLYPDQEPARKDGVRGSVQP